MFIKKLLEKKIAHKNKKQLHKPLFFWYKPAHTICASAHQSAPLILLLIVSCTMHAMQEAINTPASHSCEQTLTSDNRLSILNTQDQQAALAMMPLTQPPSLANLQQNPTANVTHDAAAALATETENMFLLESLIKLESDNIDLLTLARVTLESVNILDGFEKEASTYKVGLFGTSAAATVAWLIKNQNHPVHRSRMGDAGSTRETVNIALDIITRLLPPTIIVLGSWLGWRKIKSTMSEKYESLYAKEVKKLNAEIAALKTKLMQDAAALEQE
ncbi:hypothetical protein, partial [Methylicorpusculum sp.]|uniref:hypothetical protein n=1 Tax=Methylicorpusculum sp. TaxID=2713644 RepID=UPI002AB817DA